MVSDTVTSMAMHGFTAPTVLGYFQVIGYSLGRVQLNAIGTKKAANSPLKHDKPIFQYVMRMMAWLVSGIFMAFVL
jgi:hypothetical protein